MYTKRFLVFASIVTLFACSDRSATGPTETVVRTPPPPASLTELTGIVVVSGRDESDGAVGLSLSNGVLVSLVGSEAARLASLDGAEVFVRGTFGVSYGPTDEPATYDPYFQVDNFVVQAVAGRPALDGVLVEMEEGYALRLIDGTYHILADPPAELTGHIGARMWVTGELDELPFEFGVIE